MNKPVMISIAMVTFNHERYIQHALDSILQQETQYSFEIIIGDDKSTDETPRILKEYEKKYPHIIRVICREENLGPTKNVYDVVSRCRGKYLAFLDGDDYYTDKSKIEKQVGFLERNPEYKACAHRLEIVDKEENHILYTLSDLPLNAPMNGKHFSRYNTDMLHLNSLVFLNVIKEDLQKYKIIYESNKWSCHSMFLLICLQMSEIYVFSESMTAWRSVNEIDASNYTSKSHEKRLVFMEEKLKLYRAEKEFFGKTIRYVNFSVILAKGFLDSLRLINELNKNERDSWKKCYQTYLNFRERFFIVPVVFVERIIITIKKNVQSIIELKKRR